MGRLIFVGVILVGVASVLGACRAEQAAAVPQVNAGADGVALHGYDAVAYFTEGRPVEGRTELAHAWGGATWRFATAANRDAFAAEPARYAPQFGGYCAWAVSRGYTADADPRAWKVVDGRLYVNYNAEVAATWGEDVPGNIAKANENWPRLAKGE